MTFTIPEIKNGEDVVESDEDTLKPDKKAYTNNKYVPEPDEVAHEGNEERPPPDEVAHAPDELSCEGGKNRRKTGKLVPEVSKFRFDRKMDRRSLKNNKDRHANKLTKK